MVGCFILFSWAYANAFPLQVLGADSEGSVANSFVKDYSCGVKNSFEILECYDLGRNVFSTRHAVKDICDIYQWDEKKGFYPWGSASVCMNTLLKPISSGGNVIVLLSSLENKVVSSE